MGDTIRAITHGTIGELWQGPYVSSSGQWHIGLVALPCKSLFSEIRMNFRSQSGSYIGVDVIPSKSAHAISKFIELFGLNTTLRDYVWSRNTNIFESVGMASSTADITATLYALSKLHEINLSEADIQLILSGIERSDPIYSKTPGLYLSARQRFAETWEWKPSFTVAFAILPGKTDTDTHPESTLLEFYDHYLDEYSLSLNRIRSGFKEQKIETIAQSSTECSLLFQNYIYEPLIDELANRYLELGAIGIVRAYTGHIVGLIYDNDSFRMSKLRENVVPLFENYGLKVQVERVGYENL